MAAAVGVRTTQAVTLAAGIYPADGAQVTQAAVEAAADAHGGDIQATQAVLLVAARGRISDPNVRAWTFTLDGHDFYVLKLGTTETLIFDTHSEQWSVWGSDDSDLWRAYHGTNWTEAVRYGSVYGTSIVVGDDSNGSLYFLNPDLETDDDALLGAEVSRPFQRVVEGQTLNPGYTLFPCYSVHLLGSIGAITDTTLTSVDLTYSDDRGATFTSAGTITVPQGEIDARLDWRSLGSIKTPGRLFKIQDYGALTRIDSLMMEDGQTE